MYENACIFSAIKDTRVQSAKITIAVKECTTQHDSGEPIMQFLNPTLRSACPMLHHSDRFADPLAQETKDHKALTSKKNKTDEDHRAIARSEFMGSLYYDRAVGVFVPGRNIQAALCEAARMQKLGKVANRAIFVMDDKIPLIYDGPKTPDALFKDASFVFTTSVKTNMSKIMRTRPKFDVWAAAFRVGFNPEQIEERQMVRIFEDAGSLIGVCDYRPRFGRFSVEGI